MITRTPSKRITLTRTRSTPTEMLGFLLVDGVTFKTIERPWLFNQAGISCIPTGEYLLKWYSSPSKGMCYKVCDVPNREYILIHAANYASELQGCIALGLAQGILGGKEAVLHSISAMKEFHELTRGEPLVLTIKGEF